MDRSPEFLPPQPLPYEPVPAGPPPPQSGLRRAFGPVLAALAGAALDSDLLRALAFTGFFLNLFNLLPVVPLDGGRAMAAMAPWMWFLGLGVIVTLMLVRPNPILIIIVLFGVLETHRRW